MPIALSISRAACYELKSIGFGERLKFLRGILWTIVAVHHFGDAMPSENGLERLDDCHGSRGR